MTASSGIDAPIDLKRAPFCSVAKPITWSSRDTKETVVQVKEHNGVGKSLCNWVAA